MIGSTEKNQKSKIYRRYEVDVPRETPSLIHGDLWARNYMADNQSNTCIYDPTVYCGNKESDIIISMLFGSFSQQFYRHYNKIFPLETSWQKRINLFNIYPLLIHVNLFGGAYVSSLMNIVKKYS